MDTRSIYVRKKKMILERLVSYQQMLTNLRKAYMDTAPYRLGDYVYHTEKKDYYWITMIDIGGEDEIMYELSKYPLNSNNIRDRELGFLESDLRKIHLKNDVAPRPSSSIRKSGKRRIGNKKSSTA